MKFVILFATLALPLMGERIEEYLKFLEDQKNHTNTFGDYKMGEIEIVRDPKKIKEIEEMQMMRFKKMGLTDTEAAIAAQVGIVTRDIYWMLVRDAVIFPTGAKGTYNRIVSVSSLQDGTSGVVVMPILPDGRIVLNLNFRHATRAWELELPRGFKKKNESSSDAAMRELQEETGLAISSCHYLGSIAHDSGALAAVSPIYAGIVTKKDLSNQDYSEAILQIEAFTPASLKESLIKGWAELDMKGRKAKVFVRDPCLVYALLLAEHQKLI